MKILLFGKDGQVGWELQRSLSTIGDLVPLGHNEADLGDLGALRRCLQHHQPNLIANAAAYTAVDKAEFEPEKAKLINADAVKVLADEAAKLDALFVSYSTD